MGIEELAGLIQHEMVEAAERDEFKEAGDAACYLRDVLVKHKPVTLDISKAKMPLNVSISWRPPDGTPATHSSTFFTYGSRPCDEDGNPPQGVPVHAVGVQHVDFGGNGTHLPLINFIQNLDFLNRVLTTPTSRPIWEAAKCVYSAMLETSGDSTAMATEGAVNALVEAVIRYSPGLGHHHRDLVDDSVNKVLFRWTSRIHGNPQTTHSNSKGASWELDTLDVAWCDDKGRTIADISIADFIKAMIEKAALYDREHGLLRHYRDVGCKKPNCPACEAAEKFSEDNVQAANSLIQGKVAMEYAEADAKAVLALMMMQAADGTPGEVPTVNAGVFRDFVVDVRSKKPLAFDINAGTCFWSPRNIGTRCWALTGLQQDPFIQPVVILGMQISQDKQEAEPMIHYRVHVPAKDRYEILLHDRLFDTEAEAVEAKESMQP